MTSTVKLTKPRWLLTLGMHMADEERRVCTDRVVGNIASVAVE